MPRAFPKASLSWASTSTDDPSACDLLSAIGRESSPSRACLTAAVVVATSVTSPAIEGLFKKMDRSSMWMDMPTLCLGDQVSQRLLSEHCGVIGCHGGSCDNARLWEDGCGQHVVFVQDTPAPSITAEADPQDGHGIVLCCCLSFQIAVQVISVALVNVPQHLC